MYTDFLNKAYKWAKKNWILILIIGACIILAWRHYSFESSYESLTKHYNEQANQFQKQIKDIEKVNENWRIENEKLNIKHQKELEEIRADYKEKIENITVKRIIIQNQIIKEAKEDPTTLTKKVTEVFGIPVSK